MGLWQPVFSVSTSGNSSNRTTAQPTRKGVALRLKWVDRVASTHWHHTCYVSDVENSSPMLSQRRSSKAVSKVTFHQCEIINDDLLLVRGARQKITLNKPIAIGFTILELSKLITYRFYYDHLKSKFADRCRLSLPTPTHCVVKYRPLMYITTWHRIWANTTPAISKPITHWTGLSSVLRPHHLHRRNVTFETAFKLKALKVSTLFANRRSNEYFVDFEHFPSFCRR